MVKYEISFMRDVYPRLFPEFYLADNAAPYSDLTMWKIPGFLYEKSETCIALYLALACLSMTPIQEEDVRNKISKRAYVKNFQGQWNLVEKIIRYPKPVPGELINIYLEEKGPHALFGNMVPLMRKVARILDKQVLFLADKRFVKRPQRKRGYDDAGHLRLKHQSTVGRSISAERDPYVPILVTSSLWYEQVYGPDRNRRTQEEILASHTLLGKVETEEYLKEARIIRNRISRTKYLMRKTQGRVSTSSDETQKKVLEEKLARLEKKLQLNVTAKIELQKKEP